MARHTVAGHYHFHIMSSPLTVILGFLIAIGLAALLVLRTRQRQRMNQEAAEALYAQVMPMLESPERKPGESVGSWKLTGRYNGAVFQFTTVVDTLATRKLPSLWLLVTLPRPQPLRHTIDLMMRPGGPSTFSNFDFLPHTLTTPAGFPLQAVIRSDADSAAVPAETMLPALALFHHGPGKELLLTPKGLRIVVQLAEAQRARYGVLREARFDDAHVPSAMAAEIMNSLLALDKELAKTHD